MFWGNPPVSLRRKKGAGRPRSNHIDRAVASQARDVAADRSRRSTACKIEAVNNIVRMLGFGDGPYSNTEGILHGRLLSEPGYWSRAWNIDPGRRDFGLQLDVHRPR